ncbi:MAG: hypothetical protein ABI432_17060 [Flavobacteriales bacterium]
MNQVQENRMSMAYAAMLVLDNNTGIWSVVPAMVQAHTEFKANLTALELAVNKQVADIKGHAKDKAAAEDSMIAKTLSVAGGVMALATVNGDNGLAEAMDLTPSELRRYRDSVVAQRCMGVHDAATANAAALVAYGITAADITDLKARIDTYVALIAQPRNMITARKGATAEIGALIRDTTKLLNNRLDRLMQQFAFSQKEFHKHYFDARIIIDQHGQKDQPAEKAA